MLPFKCKMWWLKNGWFLNLKPCEFRDSHVICNIWYRPSFQLQIGALFSLRKTLLRLESCGHSAVGWRENMGKLATNRPSRIQPTCPNLAKCPATLSCRYYFANYLQESKFRAKVCTLMSQRPSWHSKTMRYFQCTAINIQNPAT